MSRHTHLKQLLLDKYKISENCWEKIEPQLFQLDLKRGDCFSVENAYNKTLGFIEEGVMRVFYRNKEGDEFNKHFLRADDFVAASINPDGKSITTIEALTKVRLLCIDYTFFIDLSKQFVEIDEFIRDKTLDYLERKQNREICLISEDATGNYLDFLKRFPGLIDQIPHYHIASYIGITSTQLSRLRKNLLQKNKPSTNVNAQKWSVR